MKLEYLIEGKEQMQDIWGMKLCTGDICCSVLQIEGTDTWLLKYEIDEERTGFDNRESDAEELYRVQQFILKKYHPLVLTNEAADFYTQTLYPEFCTYERNLRKMLYIKGTLCDDDSVTRRLKHLERKTLSQMFQLLFTDEHFVKEMKRLGEIEGWRITKDEIMENLVPCEEKTVWNELMGEDVQRVFRKKFLFLKEMRNKVMHAQDMAPVEFRKAREMLREVNQQLESESSGVKQRDYAVDRPPERTGSDREEAASDSGTGAAHDAPAPDESRSDGGADRDREHTPTEDTASAAEGRRNEDPADTPDDDRSCKVPVGSDKDGDGSYDGLLREEKVRQNGEELIRDGAEGERVGNDVKSGVAAGVKTALGAAGLTLGVAMGLALFPGLLPAVSRYTAKQFLRNDGDRKPEDDDGDLCGDESEEKENGVDLWMDDWD